ncbi:GNAT family N-acetyltransferase [Ornithinimicrobium sp. F0845]|uniref:GNAT family N-acetyltransferase n=1 Tax=Ornithinimicrobium sp. F0845 TaxID=2926412 RepID=UPI001FF29CDD|nr:GNAT family N-acetyltransferase [Ornithinimicrobium sp. F0845]MCK0114207.1 GNAT family N-acetyltransferase [Ornithinimicrobium sp. F0845]
MRIVQPSAAQLASAVALSVPAQTGLPAAEVAAEIESRRLQPEWSVVAVDESDVVRGWAMWWGRDPSVPIALDVWDVDPQVPDRAGLATALLDAGHEALAAQGVRVPLPHTMRLPNDWRDHADVAAEVELKLRCAAAAGLTRVNERLQFQWDPDQPLPPEPTSLVFAPADDETFVRLFAAAAQGSLDVLTRRELASGDAEELARAEVDFYRAAPGDRSWWRTAATTDSTLVGVAIPSATPTSRNVGFLAVLPEHRGRGHVDALLAYITRFHAKEGAPRITATTDAVNGPMAAAFHRAGYRGTETRVDLEAP